MCFCCISIRDSTTFTNGYDLTSVLFTDGGKVGFRVRVSPQPSVNYGPGGGPWWGFRFNIVTEDSGIVDACQDWQNFDIFDAFGLGPTPFLTSNVRCGLACYC